MQCIVVYDIPNDTARSRVADICLDYGLERIQFSAFLGDLARTHQEELLMKARRRVGKQPANVQLFPICDKDWAKRLTFVQSKKTEGAPGAAEALKHQNATGQRTDPAAKGQSTRITV
jgi:CRISPR-associated protein Cas2